MASMACLASFSSSSYNHYKNYSTLKQRTSFSIPHCSIGNNSEKVEKLAETSEATAAAIAEGAKHMDLEASEPTAAQNSDEIEAINGEVEANSKRIDRKSTVGDDVENVYVEDTATEDQLVTPWTYSVANGYSLLRDPQYNKGLAKR
ncbi:hypothetical protein ACFX19_018065 [Malus domestica]